MKESDIVRTMLYVINQHISDLPRINKCAKLDDDYSICEEIKPFVNEIMKAVDTLNRHHNGAQEQWSAFAKHYHEETHKVRKANKRVEALKNALKKKYGVRW
jgi:hypothetical protein